MSNKRTALITGASSGIGDELSRLFARDGYNLVLVARSEQQLLKMAEEFKKNSGTQTKVIVKDLSQASSPQEIFEELRAEDIHVDILVNNAGFATYGQFVQIDLETELQEMQVNMVTLTHLTKLFLPEMISQRYGKILNVASTAAFQPGPLMAVYYATKAYVLSFSEALANELKGSGVSVTALCPGPTISGFQKRAQMEDSRLMRFVESNSMDAHTVAEIGYQALMNNKTVIIPGLRNRLMTEAIRFTPRSVVTNVVRTMQERNK